MAGSRAWRYPEELGERAVRMVVEVGEQHASEWAAISEVARLLGVGSAETVRKWFRQAQVDGGCAARGEHRGVHGAEAVDAGERRTRARQWNSEGRVGFLGGRTRPATALITAFIAEHQGLREGPDGLRWGVESICSTLAELGVAIAPSTYYDHVSRQPSRRQISR